MVPNRARASYLRCHITDISFFTPSFLNHFLGNIENITFLKIWNRSKRRNTTERRTRLMPVLSKTKFKLPPCILFFHVTETLPVLWKTVPNHNMKIRKTLTIRVKIISNIWIRRISTLIGEHKNSVHRLWNPFSVLMQTSSLPVRYSFQLSK